MTEAPHLTSDDREELRERLEEEREKLVREYRSNVEREREVDFDQAGDLVDQALKSRGREERFGLTQAERERLILVEEALERMEEGTYGICLESDEPIPLERLRAVPWARYTTRVQERKEERPLEEGIEPS
ncbi:MAG: TraR/DksA family transcriptional regulator [Thermoanaerobaculia bacterium]|nr:TraR/DksA family transcriptional regulator [Thermoanaerobaculia bacterium]